MNIINWLIIVIINIINANLTVESNFFITGSYYENKLFCVTNTSAALTWIDDNVQYQTEVSTLSTFASVSPNSFDCNFKLNENCLKDWLIEGWELKNSIKENVEEKIIDRRWEALELHTTEFEGRNEVPLKFTTVIDSQLSSNFKIPLSIRIQEEAHIFLCDGEQINLSHCYWLMLQAWQSKATAIRKCYVNKIPIISNTYPQGYCQHTERKKHHKINEKYPNFLTNNFWNHFYIKKKDNKISFIKSVNNIDQHILEYEDTDYSSLINISHVIIHSKIVNGFWKIHNYDYLYIEKEIQNVKLGSTINVFNERVCISMFVKICENCQLILSLSNEHQSISYKTETFSTKSTHWQEIRFIVEKIKTATVVLMVSTKSNSNSKNFWAIDDVKLCEENGIRSIFTTSKKECQLLPKDKTINLNMNTKQIESNCSEDTIGPQCVPCSYFYSKCDCTKICVNDRDSVSCQWSAGYYGPKCSSDFISDEEFPSILNTTSNYIDLEDINCTKYKGDIYIQLNAKCLELWCKTAKNIQTNLLSFKNLKKDNANRILISLSYPFSTYNITITLCRNYWDGRCRDKSYTITTLPDKPNKISQLTVYSKDENYIKIKWKPPYPPTGILEEYKIKKMKDKYWNIPGHQIEIPVSVQACEIWHDWHCAELTFPNKEKEFYYIEVSAKNQFIDTFSDIVSVNAYTEKTSSSAPDANFTMDWTDKNDLILSWEHPFTTNGDLNQFDIVIESDEKTSEETYPITKYNLTYTYLVNSSKLLPSKYYTVEISANNGIKGQKTSKTDSSPPEMPKFEKFNLTNTNNIIELKATLSLIEDSKLYVFKSTKNEVKKLWNNFTQLNKYLKRLNLKSNDIITYCKLAHKDVVVTIVNDRVISKENCSDTNAIEILPEKSYNLIIILENTFNGKNSYKWYSKKIIIPDTDIIIKNDNQFYIIAFYILIIIILMVFVISFIYVLNKYIKERRRRDTKPSTIINMINIKKDFTSQFPEIHLYEELKPAPPLDDDKNQNNGNDVANNEYTCIDKNEYAEFVNVGKRDQIIFLNSKI